MSLFDTTQLALSPRCAARAPPDAAGQQPRQRRHPRLPAPGRRLPRRARRRAPVRPVAQPGPFQPVHPTSGARRRQRVDAEPSRPSSPRTARSTRRSPGRRAAQSILQLAIGIGQADEHVRRHRHLRQRAHRPAPADGRHGREPRQRPDHPRRQRPALPPQGGRPAAGRRLRRALTGAMDQTASGRAASRSRGIVADQTPDKIVYDPGHPDANAQGYVQMPNVDTVTEMVDLIDASRAYEANVTAMQAPSRCSPRPSSCSSDADDPVLRRSAPGVAGRLSRLDRLDAGRRPGPQRGRRRLRRRRQLRRTLTNAISRSSRPRCRAPPPPGARHRPGDRPDPVVMASRRPARDAARQPDPQQGRRSGPGDLPDPGVRSSMIFGQLAPSCPPRAGDGRRAAAATIVFLFFMQVRVRAVLPTLLTGLDPAQTGKITARSTSKGISYELRNNGTALAVNKTGRRRGSRSPGGAAPRQLAARLRPARQAPSSAPRSSSSRSPTSARWRARSPTRSTASRASLGAKCSSCCPRTSCSPTSTQPATAAVMLRTRPTLQPGAVRGIAQLAASVKGLKIDNVTITDGSASCCGRARQPAPTAARWPSRRPPRRATRADRGQAQRDARADARPGKAAGAGHRRPQRRQDHLRKLTYGKKGTPLETTDQTREAQGRRRHAAAPPAPAQHPRRRRQTARGSDSNYKHKTDDRPFGVDKTVTTPTSRPARSTSQTSRCSSTSRSRRRRHRAQAAVADAAGIDTKRGDTSDRARWRSPSRPRRRRGPVPTTLIGPLKWVGLGLGALIFLFFMTRPAQARGRVARHAGLAERDRGADALAAARAPRRIDSRRSSPPPRAPTPAGTSSTS